MRPRRPGAELAPGYEVVEHLARSNSLDVYDAWSAERHCRVVVKALRPDRRNDAGARRALVREGELLARLAHPSIVRGYETRRSPDPLIAIELLGGETVAHLVERRRPTAGEIALLGLQLGAAVRYLHAHDTLHLDLKPSNVIAHDGRAKMIDLSVARPPGTMRAGIGTWCYMAPEQARGGEVGPAADVWGVGMVLYCAAAGDSPFAVGATGHAQVHSRAPAVGTRRTRLPRRLSAAIDSCLEPAPADRPPLETLLAELEQVAGTRG